MNGYTTSNLQTFVFVQFKTLRMMLKYYHEACTPIEEGNGKNGTVLWVKIPDFILIMKHGRGSIMVYS